MRTIGLFVLSLVVYATIFSSVSYAEIAIRQPVENSGVQVGTGDADSLVGTVLRNAITIIFVIASIGVVIMFLWGATEWILSGGDKEKVAGARKRISSALIGMVLIAISFFLIGLLGSILNFNPLGELKIPHLGTGTVRE